jgi:hypothetical protein
MTEARRLIENLRTDCVHYLGDRPCRPHVEAGHRCTCIHLKLTKRRGVIIKLGAAGDVLRSTPLLRALDPAKTGTKILWFTHSPDLLPTDACEAVHPTAATLARIAQGTWDSVGTWTRIQRLVPSPHLRKRWSIEATRFGTAWLIRLIKLRSTNLRQA